MMLDFYYIELSPLTDNYWVARSLATNDIIVSGYCLSEVKRLAAQSGYQYHGKEEPTL
jgi:hypothetical protein